MWYLNIETEYLDRDAISYTVNTQHAKKYEEGFVSREKRTVDLAGGQLRGF